MSAEGETRLSSLYCKNCQSFIVFAGKMSKKCHECGTKFDEEEVQRCIHTTKRPKEEAGGAENGTAGIKKKEAARKKKEVQANTTRKRGRPRLVKSSDDDGDEDAEGKKAKKSIDVPDANVYDFDEMIRKAADIREGQIWAIYDSNDGMPRLYARVDKVDRGGASGAQAHVTWLDVVENSHNEKWIEAGFHQVVGEFILGNKGVIDLPNCFSHLVDYAEEDGVYKIYPKKGQAWAVYREWNGEWMKDGIVPSPRQAGLCMVEVVSHFMDGVGVVVGPLTKIEGVATVFQKHPSILGLVKWHELSKFSHLVPSMPLFELDPAATTTSSSFNT